MANRKINELSVRTPSLTDLMIVGDPSTGYSFKATLAALNSLIVNTNVSINDLSGVSIVSPTTNQVLQYDGTNWVNATLTDNGITSLNGLTALSQTFATGTSGTDFAISSTTSTHTFNLPTASAVNRGALSSADWSTFNAKQDAITLTTTGSSGSATLVGATLNIPTYTLSGLGGISGSGTSGQVAYWTGTSSQSGSNNLFWDNANNRLGIGTNAPSYRLHNVGSSGFDNGNSGDAITILNNGFIQMASTRLRGFGNVFQFQDNSFNTRVNLNMTSAISYFNSGGNYHFGGTTDGGQRLQVTGDVLFKGSGNTSGSTALTVQNSDGTNRLRVRNDGYVMINGDLWIDDDFRRIFAGSARATVSRTSTGTSTIFYNAFQLTNNNAAWSLYSDAAQTITSGSINGLFVRNNFAPTSGTATFSNEILTVINQTGGANGITRGLYVNPTLTAAADWRSIEWSNNSGWGLYGAGSANNYLGGNLGIGNTAITNVNLRISRNIEGSSGSYGVFIDGSIRSGVTSQAVPFVSAPSIQNTAFTLSQLRNFYAIGIASTGSATITNQSGFYAENTLTGATNNYGFYGDIASGTGRWNLYMSGTAANYMNGNLLLGSTTDGGQKLQVTGTSRFTSTLRFDENIRDNRDNNVIVQSASGVASNRDFTIGNGTYGRMMLTSRQVSFTSGTHPSLGAYGFYYNGETATGAAAGFSIYFKAQTPSAANSNGGDFIIELPSGTGTGRQGSVIIGGTSPNASAILELSSTTKGFLPPVMTNAQMVAIGTPASGLMVYDTTNNKLNVYDGTNWVAVH